MIADLHLPYLALALSFPITLVLLRVLLASGIARIVVDSPNERSLHASPVPRVGGIGIMASICAVYMLLPQGTFGPLLAIMGGLFLISLLDDRLGLPPLWRILSHLLAGTAFVLLNFPGWGLVAAICAVLLMAWMTNLYNFMDGADGLAGGMTLFGFAAYGAAAWMAGDLILAASGLAVAAAAGAFLVFNFAPARIFLGDSGSIPLGFLAGALGLLGWGRGLWPWWFPPLVFSPFIVDATVTLIRRLLRGERVWRAHKNHYYQRLVRLGWGHRKTALAGYALMLATGGSALWANMRGEEHLVLGFWVLAYSFMLAWIDFRWHRQQGGV